MSHHPDLQISTIPLRSLRPTQMTVGQREVKFKRKRWDHEDQPARSAYLRTHMVPVVTGPKGRPYLVDHHHLVCALFDEGIEGVFVSVIADLSHLSTSEFWAVMDMKCWAHPYDADGERHAFSDIPKHVQDLADDPYRSLAGALERRGGFAKSMQPFAEFLWADFLRRRIKAKELKSNFDSATEAALDLVRSRHAAHLPGWCGDKGRD